MKTTRNRWLLSIALLGWMTLPVAAESTGYRITDGLTVYLGVIPAALIQGHAADHAEAEMHDGVPRGRYAYHITVAVFDSVSGERVEDAQVRARVTPPGLAPVERNLEPMPIADTVTYGNYFTMRDDGPHRIRIEIRSDDADEPVVAEFTHDHGTR